MTDLSDRLESHIPKWGPLSDLMYDLIEATEVIRELSATNAQLVEALDSLLHAVCGETGFASAVRLDSGLAYPWPALEMSEQKARAAIAAVKQ